MTQLRLPISTDWKKTLENWAAELRSINFISTNEMGGWQNWEPIVVGSGGMSVANQKTRAACFCKMLHLCRIELDCIVDYTGAASNFVSIKGLPFVPSWKALLPVGTFGSPQIQVGEVRLTMTAGEVIGRAYLTPDSESITVVKNDNSNFDITTDKRICFSGFYPIDNFLPGAS